jgi:hypothetical protein
MLTDGVAVCHCCCRTAALEKDVVMAQLQAQAAAIAQEREALSVQRINTDVLASLSEQVGRPAVVGSMPVCLEKGCTDMAAYMNPQHG